MERRSCLLWKIWWWLASLQEESSLRLHSWHRVKRTEKTVTGSWWFVVIVNVVEMNFSTLYDNEFIESDIFFLTYRLVAKILERLHFQFWSCVRLWDSEPNIKKISSFFLLYPSTALNRGLVRNRALIITLFNYCLYAWGMWVRALIITTMMWVQFSISFEECWIQDNV